MKARPVLPGQGADHFDAVLLDAAGTLIRPSAPVGRTYAEIAARFGVSLDVGRLSQAFGEVFSAMPPLAFDWTSMNELQRLEREWWSTLVRRVLARAGRDPGDFDCFFDALYQHYAEGPAWECFPEVPRVLDDLLGMGCKLAVVSNFDSRLPGILRALGLYDRFDAVVYSSEAGSAKPDSMIFRKALGALGVEPRSAIHVGDDARADVAGAGAVGIAGALILRDQPPTAASGRVIRCLDELLVRVAKGRPTLDHR